MGKIVCFGCQKQKNQIKGRVRTILKEELVELFKKYKNREFVSGLTACQKCIKQVEQVIYNYQLCLFVMF